MAVVLAYYLKKLFKFESFEYMDARFRSLQSIRILVIYRPSGHSSYDLFYEEFSKLIGQTADSPGGLLIVGNFNVMMLIIFKLKDLWIFCSPIISANM